MLPVVHPEFREQTLASRIIQGVLEHDSVRAHGAVVAALQLYPIDHAIADVFLPALRALEETSGVDARQSAAAVIRAHVRQLMQGQDI
jgi:hypothetical protein